MRKFLNIMLIVILIFIIGYIMFNENIEKLYYSFSLNMPINRIYNDIYSLIYESELDNDTFKWIVYGKDKNKKN